MPSTYNSSVHRFAVFTVCWTVLLFVAGPLVTCKGWVAEQPQLEASGSPSIHSLSILNAAVIYLQVILGAGFRHKDIPIWPHMAGAILVLGMVIWTVVALRKRFEKSRELSKARILLHAIFGTQFLLGLAAFWSRRTTADAPQPMPVMVTLTVIHTVVGAILFAFSLLVVLACYRLVPRRREVAATEPRQVTTG